MKKVRLESCRKVAAQREEGGERGGGAWRVSAAIDANGQLQQMLQGIYTYPGYSSKLSPRAMSTHGDSATWFTLYLTLPSQD